MRVPVCVCACVLMYALRIVSLDTEALALYEYFKKYLYIIIIM